MACTIYEEKGAKSVPPKIPEFSFDFVNDIVDLSRCLICQIDDILTPYAEAFCNMGCINCIPLGGRQVAKLVRIEQPSERIVILVNYYSFLRMEVNAFSHLNLNSNFN